MPKRARPEGIVIRHRKACAALVSKKPCDCRPGYQAQVYSGREGRTIRKTFRALADARAWRAETQSSLNRGALQIPSRTRIEAVEVLAGSSALGRRQDPLWRGL